MRRSASNNMAYKHFTRNTSYFYVFDNTPQAFSHRGHKRIIIRMSHGHAFGFRFEKNRKLRSNLTIQICGFHSVRRLLGLGRAP